MTLAGGRGGDRVGAAMVGLHFKNGRTRDGVDSTEGR